MLFSNKACNKNLLKFLTISMLLLNAAIFGNRIVNLTAPNLSEDNVEQEIICIRPMRDGIFKIEAEVKDHKLICHNYGHGGAGWTLSFGSVFESIRQFEHMLELNPSFKNKPIRIIGAGCMGLLTAVSLAFAGYNVEITARDLTNIASYKAAGLLCPGSIQIPEDKQKTFNIIAAESYREFAQIAQGKHPYIKTGATFVPIYVGLDTQTGLDRYVHLGLIENPEYVTIDFGNAQHNVLEYKVIFINTIGLMQELHRLCQDLGIKIQQAEVNDFKDVKESIIFNCTGLGAADLNADEKMIPVQGHLVMLQNQPSMNEMQYMLYTLVKTKDEQGNYNKEYVYYTPKKNGVLGGTFIPGENSLESNRHHFKKIIERSRNYFGVSQ